jgi:hypothetical protein
MVRSSKPGVVIKNYSVILAEEVKRKIRSCKLLEEFVV